MLYDPSNNRQVAAHRWLSLHCGYREEPFLDAGSGALIVPIDADGNVLFILEPTIFDGIPVLMLPAGAVDEGETPQESAGRELQEEIGFKAERIELLAELHPMARHARLSNFACLARDLSPSRLQGDEPYELEVRRVPLDDFESLIQSGELRDASVIAALFLARSHIARNG
jgi:ADP-ribose diphosphatase